MLTLIQGQTSILLNAEAAIKPRRNSSTKSRGSYLRAKAAREFLLDPERWKDSVS